MDLQQVLAAGASGSIARRRAADACRCRRRRRQRRHPADRQPLAHGLPARERGDRAHGHRRALPPDWPGTLVVVPTRSTRCAHGSSPRSGSTGGACSATPPTTACGCARRSARRSASPPPRRRWVIGEHGDGCVPLFDRVRVDGEPVALSPDQGRPPSDFVRGWYVRHVALDPAAPRRGPGARDRAHGCRAARRPAAEPWPASVVLTASTASRVLRSASR